MRPLFFFALIALLAACKKDKVAPQSEPIQYSKIDFALVPTKDAKWYVTTLVDNDCFPRSSYNVKDIDINFMKDILWRVNYVIEAIDKDTIIDNQTYHVYDVKLKAVNPVDSTENTTSAYRYYLREDITRQKVYTPYGDTVLDFSDEGNKGQVVPFPSWREVTITKSDGLVIAGQYLKSWEMQNTGDANYKHFYKAIGVGGTSGILRLYSNTTAFQVTSLGFVYKGDSIHFDFPLQ